MIKMYRFPLMDFISMDPISSVYICPVAGSHAAYTYMGRCDGLLGGGDIVSIAFCRVVVGISRGVLARNLGCGCRRVLSSITVGED